MLGNLIENAADAAAGAKAPYVRVSGSETDAQSIIIIANSYGGTIKKRGGKYLSSKHEGTGLDVYKRQETSFGGSPPRILSAGRYIEVYIRRRSSPRSSKICARP